eukprot:jgi/Mesvir1/2794/Mv21707-RA.2
MNWAMRSRAMTAMQKLASLARSCMRHHRSTSPSTLSIRRTAPESAATRRGYMSEPSYYKPRGATGLYGIPELSTPEGFAALTRAAKDHSEYLIQRIVATPPSLATLDLMDEMSNTLCKVMDVADLCRNTHPHARYVAASQAAYLDLSAYTQGLNTNRTLYDALVAAMQQDGATWTEEQQIMAHMLRVDFERGGIHLPAHKRSQVENLQARIEHVSSQFSSNIHNHHETVDIYPATLLSGLSRPILSMQTPLPPGWTGGGQHGSPDGPPGLRVTAEPIAMHAILKWVADPGIRKSVYVAGNKSPANNMELLAELIHCRHLLASTLGFPSYAHFQLSNTLAATPGAVRSFLTKQSEMLRPRLRDELASLAALKAEFEGTGGRGSVTSSWGPFTAASAGGVAATGGYDHRGGGKGYHGGGASMTIEPWERGYFSGIARSRKAGISGSVVASYLPLDACLRGIALLADRVFGVRMKEEEPLPGEVWAPEVHKMRLTQSATNEPLGMLYLDLHARRGKYCHAAHFTIRCGCQTRDGARQTPVVALVLNLPQRLPSAPPLVNHSDLETLFHEFGHALHSMMSRTVRGVQAGVCGRGVQELIC